MLACTKSCDDAAAGAVDAAANAAGDAEAGAGVDADAKSVFCIAAAGAANVAANAAGVDADADYFIPWHKHCQSCTLSRGQYQAVEEVPAYSI